MPNALLPGVRSLLLRQAVAKQVESLETRTLLSSTINSAGWTVVTPPSSARVIYVSSSSGNDSNTGLSQNDPVKSIARGESMLRNHTGDELLLKSGDVFYNNFIFWTLSGASEQDPMVLGSYGTGARPEIMTGAKYGLETGKVSSPEVDFLDILGINFHANGRDPSMTSEPATASNPDGINILTKGTGIVVENCEFQYYTIAINFQDYLGPINDVTVRRNIIIDSYAVNAHSQGLYATGVHNLDIEGNLFDANGYNAKVGAAPTVFNQDCYLAYDDSNCVVKDNVFSRAAATGLEDRPGGIVENNTFIDDPVGMTFGLVNGAKTTVGGVTGVVSGNVFIGGGNTGNFPEGQGLEIGNIKPGAGAIVTKNIFTQGGDNSSPAILICAGKSQIDPQDSVGVNDLVLSQNVIYDWSTGIDFVAGLTPGGKGISALNRVTIKDNQFEELTGPSVENHSGTYLAQESISGNTYYHSGQWVTDSRRVPTQGTTLSSPMAFPAPARSVASYDSALGNSGSTADFLAHAADASASNYDPSLGGAALSAYILQGFGLTSSSTTTGGSTGGSGGTTGGGDTGTGDTGSGGTTTTGGSTGTSTGTGGTTTGGSTGTGSARLATSTFGAVNWDAAKGVKPNGPDLGFADNGDWAEYKQIDFGTGTATFKAKVAGVKGNVGTIQLRLDSPTGKLVGSLKVAPTGSWNTYTLQSTAVSGATGVHNLYLVFVGNYGVANVASFSFAASADPSNPPTRLATSTIDALDYNGESGIASDHFKGIGSNGGNWVEYSQIDFGVGATKFEADIAALSKYAGSVQIRLDSPTGTLVGTLKIAGTGAWNRYVLQSTTIKKVTGIHKLYLVFTGGKAVGNVESFSFA